MSNRGLQKWMVVHSFHNGLNDNMRYTMDVEARGKLMSEVENQAYNLIEEITLNNSNSPMRSCQPRGLKVSLMWIFGLYLPQNGCHDFKA